MAPEPSIPEAPIANGPEVVADNGATQAIKSEADFFWRLGDERVDHRR